MDYKVWSNGTMQPLFKPRVCAPPPPSPPPPAPSSHAKVASNYVKTSCSPLNPLSKAINAGKII